MSGVRAALFTNHENINGDRCPPWGTPKVDGNISGFCVEHIITYCDLFDKYELNQDKIESSNPEARSIEIRNIIQIV